MEKKNYIISFMLCCIFLLSASNADALRRQQAVMYLRLTQLSKVKKSAFRPQLAYQVIGEGNKLIFRNVSDTPHEVEITIHDGNGELLESTHVVLSTANYEIELPATSENCHILLRDWKDVFETYY